MAGTDRVQDSHMRMARGALAVVSVGAGLWLMLRALGLLTVTGHDIERWWPALLLASGVAILLRSVRPGPHVAAALGLIGAGGVAFAIIRGAVPVHIWIFVASGVLICTGLALAFLSVKPHHRQADGRAEQIRVMFRAATSTPGTADLERIRALVFCGQLELDLRDIIPPGARRDRPLMVEITTWLGDVRVLAWEGVDIIDHKAFVLQLGKAIRAGFLDQDVNESAQIVVATLAFFGRVEVKRIRLNAASDPRGSGPELDRHRPATQ